MKRASFALLVIGWTTAVGASPCLDYARQEFKKYLPPTDPVFTDAFYAQVEPIVKRALAKAEGTAYAANVRPAWASVCYSQMTRLLRRSAGRYFVVSRNPEVYDAALKLLEVGFRRAE